MEFTIDAIVVAVSVSLGGGAILTSDPDDIKGLADASLSPFVRSSLRDPLAV